MRVTKFTGGAVHEATASKHGWTFECDGRTVRDYVATDAPLSCKRCVKKAGVDNCVAVCGRPVAVWLEVGSEEHGYCLPCARAQCEHQAWVRLRQSANESDRTTPA